jgi:hypothetical protein
MPMDWGPARDYAATDVHLEETPVTEAEWLDENVHPAQAIIGLYTEVYFGRARKATDRSLRLFASACCSDVEPLVNDGLVRTILTVVERYADGLATEAEYTAAGDAIEEALRQSYESAEQDYKSTNLWIAAPVPSLHLIEATAHAAGRNPGVMSTGGWYSLAMHAVEKCGRVVQFATGEFGKNPKPQTEAAWRRQMALLRDCLGNPIRPLPLLAPAGHRLKDSTALQLAGKIYDHRAFDRLPVLADALEDAGCIDADLLGHLRSPRPHVRGCWAVDLVLGKS